MSMRVPFRKMHGAGNDFIMIDGRDLAATGLALDRDRIARWCTRRLGIGADGLIVVAPDDEADFRMTYYNADGLEATMCGNGARCSFAFARERGLIDRAGACRTRAGIVRGEVRDDGVAVELAPPGPLTRDVPLETDHPFGAAHLVDTGVPHVVLPVPNVEAVDVPRWGPRLRRDPALGPAGANVDWVQVVAPDAPVLIRTYERGVEEETLACGTGAAAAALVLVELGLSRPPVTLLTRGGFRLTIDVAADGDWRYLTLTGPTAVVFSGEVTIDE